MIPKKIHYCWFGGNPLPELALKCINSWKTFFPDYEIIEWNEGNFDINMTPYISEAYKAKKYAFVSDFARFWVLHKYGGLYFDTDVEVIKNMDAIVSDGPFMGCENCAEEGGSPEMIRVAPGLGMGSEPNMVILDELIDYYSRISFINEDGTYNQVTIVDHTTSVLAKYGLQNTASIQCCSGFRIYPKEYFCPMDYITGELVITPNTYSIHHYMASWLTTGQKYYKIVDKYLGSKIAKMVSTTLKKLGLIK